MPLHMLFAGYRSVILHNVYGEELELAALLVHIDIEPWTVYDMCSINRRDKDLQRETELQKVARQYAKCNAKLNVLHVQNIRD